MTSNPPEFTAAIAERTVVVTWPDNDRGGAMPPPDGWQERAWATERTLHEIDEGSVSGCSVLRWRNDPRSDTELIAASLALVTGKPAASAVFPEPPSRAAIEAAAFRAAASYVRGHSADERYGKASISTALCVVSDELYRWADDVAAEEQPAEAQQQPAAEAWRCDAGFVFGGRCIKPAGHRDPHVTAPVAQQPAADTRREPDPEAVEREREIQRDAQLPRVKHSGPDTEFCVLCLSGEHERVAAEQQPAAADDEETPFVPPAHYVRDDGVECCVHTIPVGPDSCRACRELADDA